VKIHIDTKICGIILVPERKRNGVIIHLIGGLFHEDFLRQQRGDNEVRDVDHVADSKVNGDRRLPVTAALD